jgi:hypothetical protein
LVKCSLVVMLFPPTYPANAGFFIGAGRDKQKHKIYPVGHTFLSVAFAKLMDANYI